MTTRSRSRKKGKGAEDARERVLQAAEELFNEFGYTSVTVQDIARKLGIKAASLYYHAPGGKEELFVMVLERSLARHKQGVDDAIARAGTDLRDRCREIIGWFLSQGPLGFLRLLMSDLPGLEGDNATRLKQLAEDSLIQPLCRIFEEAAESGNIRTAQPRLMASSLLSMVDGIWYAATIQGNADTEELASGYVDVLIDGLRPR
ncbi:MAG: TetR/AcrR family transcriptional regulator [Acidobacteriota bacterium]|nr:TetR/AcrR family transcriptional regulator [Acidobacteriota bacterium]